MMVFSVPYVCRSVPILLMAKSVKRYVNVTMKPVTTHMAVWVCITSFRFYFLPIEKLTNNIFLFFYAELNQGNSLKT